MAREAEISVVGFVAASQVRFPNQAVGSYGAVPVVAESDWRKAVFFVRQRGLRAYPRQRCGGCGHLDRKGYQLWCNACDARLSEHLHKLVVTAASIPAFWSLVRQALRFLRCSNRSLVAGCSPEGTHVS